jgi:hypothetical protein
LKFPAFNYYLDQTSPLTLQHMGGICVADDSGARSSSA